MRSKRKALSKKTRFEVFKRDIFTCQYCGATPPGVLLQVDHITAVANGGGNEIDNLLTACQPCNIGKGAIPLSVSPRPLSEKAAEIAEREAQLLGYQEILEAKRSRLEEEAWRIFRMLYGPETVEVKREEFISVKRFLERLALHETLQAAEIAAARVPEYRRFRYFCGVCWKMIKELDGR